MTHATPGGSPRQRFRSRLAARPLLVDGGLGTLLFSRGVPQRACLEELVTTHPEMVGAAHREYLEAGAELIETLSFGANRQRLAAWGLEGQVGRLNRRAAQLAREAREVSGRDALVGGSVGPLGSADPGRHGHPGGRRAGGVPRADRGPARGRRRPDRPRDVLGPRPAAARRRRGPPRLGRPGHRLADVRRGARPGRRQQPGGAAARRWPAPAPTPSGSTAAPGRRPVSTRSRRWALAADGDPARSIMPNAGLSQRLEGRFVYAASAEYFGTVTPRLLAAGARIVGGCCGTTPEHIAAMRAALDAPEAPARGADRRRRRAAHRRPIAPTAPGRRSSSGAPPRRPPTTRRRRPAWPSSSTPAGSSSRSRSTRRGASGSSGRSRPPGSCATPASTSSTSPTRRWPGSG